MVALVLIAALAQAQPAASPPGSPPPPPACISAPHRAFDFWVGEWEVGPTGHDLLLARSRIERLHDGCVIRETWMPLKGGGGSSLSGFDPVDGRWHQRWIASNGVGVDFDGGMAGGEMVLTGFWRDVVAPGQHALVRMRYSRNADGSVRQRGEQSVDHGLSWQPSFDFTYRPARPR